jgi:hypothetical protein
MEYTVQTSPNIGSAHVTGVHDGTFTVPISGMTYGAEYHWFVNITDGTHWTRKVFRFDTGYPSQYDPFEFGWQYRKQITINHTQVADEFEDFPVLISTTDSDLIKAQGSGIDIVFMDGPGVAQRLNYEIETFVQSIGSLTAFVNIPTLSSTQDTVFYMYYGNPSCINQQYPEKVWNPDFKAVWHLRESPVGTIHDSTSYRNDAVSHGGMDASNVVSGRVGNCLSFDGINDYLTAPDSPSLDPTEVTLLCWVKMAAPITGRSVLGKGCMDEWWNQDAVSYGISYINGEMGSICEKDDNTATIAKYTAAENTWYYAAMTYDSASTMVQYYQDGILRDSLSHGQALRYSDPWDFVFAAGHVHEGSGVDSDDVPEPKRSCELREFRT